MGIINTLLMIEILILEGLRTEGVQEASERSDHPAGNKRRETEDTVFFLSSAHRPGSVPAFSSTGIQGTPLRGNERSEAQAKKGPSPAATGMGQGVSDSIDYSEMGVIEACL